MSASKDKVTIEVAGRTLQGTANAGLNRVVWDLNDANRRPLQAGEYPATLQIGDRKFSQTVRILE